MSEKKQRCWWCGDDPLYVAYHDEEWGRPTKDDRYIFEKLCLEGFQAGLSWITILRKRENFRKAFANFDLKKLNQFTDKDVDRLLKDEGIVRHRGKIESVLNNAARAVELKKEYGTLAAYFWKWEPALHERPKKFDEASVKSTAKTETSLAISKDLKKRGWSFVGPTTIYSFMQATGIVNDHVEDCFCRKQAQKEKKSFSITS